MKNVLILFCLIGLCSCEVVEDVLIGNQSYGPDCSYEMEALSGDPRILSIGDSFAWNYQHNLKDLYPSKQVLRNNCTMRSSAHGISMLPLFVNHAPSWDVCTFNLGVGDIRTGVSISTYLDNLTKGVELLHQKCEKVLFINLTVIGETKNDGWYANVNDAKISEYNEAAETLMTQIGVPVCDLYSVSGPLKVDMVSATSFDEASREILAQEVADCIDSL